MQEDPASTEVFRKMMGICPKDRNQLKRLLLAKSGAIQTSELLTGL